MNLLISIQDLEAFSKADDTERENMRARASESQLHGYAYILKAEIKGASDAADLFQKQTNFLKKFNIK